MARILTVLTLTALVGGFGAAVAQQTPPEPPGASLLPQAPGRAEVVRVCSKCHALEIVTQKHMDPDGWYELVQTMRDRGAKGTDEEMGAITAYLAGAFPPG